MLTIGDRYKRRGCNKGSFLVPANPIHILCVISFRYSPFVIENLALTGLRFGTFGAVKVGWVTAYKQDMMTLNSDLKIIVIDWSSFKTYYKQATFT